MKSTVGSTLSKSLALCLTGLALVLGGCAGGTSPSQTAQATTPPAYRLGAGDRVQVVVYGERDMSGEYDIDEMGNVSLPLAGRVKVANMSPGDAERALAAQLNKGLINDPKVTVNVVRYRPFYILGEVQRPGAYPYYAGATVLNAVAQAGGYTYRAQKRGIEVVRQPDPAAAGQNLTTTETAAVAPGDVIIVPERWF